ncbi:MAG: hypothetical protein P1P90_02570 [Patescibacteria group bacterium]|nr:hypothetical protein [Patescibacteria group bacterium]
MRLEEWRFNTRIAWDNPLMRWGAVVTLSTIIGASVYSAIRLFSLSLPSGYVVTHYTVYLGIDQVLPVIWIIPIILVPVLLISGTIAVGYLFFRQDSLAGTGLLSLAFTTTIIWIIQLFHLIKINI